jgi:anaerobic selenocysteine-containing dehydrogenase
LHKRDVRETHPKLLPPGRLAMPTVTRRGFVGGAAAVAGVYAGSDLLFGGSEILAPTQGDSLTAVAEDVVRTTCWIGKQDCGVLARRVNGRVVKFDGDPANPRNGGTLCPKGQAQISSIYDPNRVKTPLVRTNAKGEPGEWNKATWGEALAMVAARVNEVRERNPKMVLWQKGRSKAEKFYDDAFVKAIGSSKLGHGAYCSDAGYRALEYTVGLHGVFHPDFENTNYLLGWGWNITNAGGNKFCWLTWPRQMVAARERGLKIVHIDPRLRSAGPFADTWLPIRPGTDLALALALASVLIENGFVDTEYLTTYTNAPYLVGDDGLFLRVDDLPQVWDEDAGGPVSASGATAPALEGTFEVDGQSYRTGFTVWAEHVAGYTPEWAADVCGLPADRIRTIGVEFGEAASIGSTKVVDGVEIPYRPAAVMAYHMSQQELGFQALRAMTMLNMMVGAIGAVGGTFSDFTWKIHKNYEAFEEISVEDPPYDFILNHSKYFPINTGFPGMVAKVMLDPARYEVEEIPEVAILHMVNPLLAFPGQPEIIESYKKFEFVTVISPWLNETADYFADVVLPAATVEKYEGPISATDQYIDATTMRIPAMEPLFDSKGEIDIYLDLTEEIGVLYGEEGYLAQVNEALGLEDEFALPLDTKPTPREILDRWSKAQGLEDGIEYFEQNGVLVKGRLDPLKRFGYVADPPFGGVVHRLYGESLLKVQREMQAKGADEIYWQDYTALPTWREPTMEQSPSDYDLYLISYHQIENKQSRTGFIPLLAELTPGQKLDINPATARAKGLDDGQEVWVESHNAVTGETRRVKTKVAYSEAIRPDTVGMSHHFGLWTHPVSKERGPSPNEIFPTGEGYMANTADQSYHVKVKVESA